MASGLIYLVSSLNTVHEISAGLAELNNATRIKLQINPSELYDTYLPSIIANHASNKRRHGLVGTSGLHLIVFGLTLTAATTFELLRFGLVVDMSATIEQVFLLQAAVLLLLILAGKFLWGHCTETLGCDLAAQKSYTKTRILLILQSQKSTTDFVFVLEIRRGLVFIEDRLFDTSSDFGCLCKFYNSSGSGESPTTD